MQLRKNKSNNIQVNINNDWCNLQNCDQDILDLLSLSKAEIIEQFAAVKSVKSTELVIPFRPSAYRDFMLYEKHAIDAARGFVKKYMPKLLPVVKTYEKITGKPFPKLKPGKRFYQHPIYYMGNHLNFFTDGDVIVKPTYTAQMDYELEIGAVITKPLRNASIEEVTDAIGGFVILNDFSARDVQLSEMDAGFGPMKTKNFGSSISSTVAHRDGLIDRLDSLQTKVLVNDKLIMESNTSGKQYSMQEAIAYASWEEQLHPGELFGSGTIPGCTGIENGVMLDKGDKITLVVEGIGELSNVVG